MTDPENLPIILAFEVQHTENELVCSISYIEPRHQHEDSRKITHSEFRSTMNQGIEDSVEDIYAEIQRLVDLVDQEENRRRIPQSIPSRKRSS